MSRRNPPCPPNAVALGASLLLAACSGCHETGRAAAPASREAGAVGAANAAPMTAPPAASSASAAPLPPEPPRDAIRSQQDCPAQMLFIPAGTFEYTGPVPGSADKSPKKQVFHLQPFCIDQFEVPEVGRFEGKDTDYEAVEATCGKRSSLCMTYTKSSSPATCVTVQQAECFCAHILPGQPKRLPTDAEWLYAALGTDGRPFPWGQEEFPPGVSGHQNGFCSFSNGIHEDPGDSLCYPDLNTRDRGPFGVIGMATNGSELVRANPDGTGENKWLVRGPIPGDDHTSLVQQIGPYGTAPRPDGTESFRCVLSKRAVP